MKKEFEYIGECNGNDGNGCFMVSCGHNCGCFKRMPKQEESYSEEEVGELVYNIIGEYGKHYGIMIDGAKLNELFEQFKKK